MAERGKADPAPDRPGLPVNDEGFRLLVESVHDYAIFMLDPAGIVSTWNAGAARIKGYAADEIVGRHFSVFYPPSDVAAGKPERELHTAAREGRAEDEAWRLRKDGTAFWANVVITALRDGRGGIRGFAKVTRDLTERRAREEAERAAALHAATSRLKDEFLAVVSHELRTPLNVAIGQAMLLQNAQLPPDQAQRAWESLHRNLQLQAQIVDDLLDVSRIVTGKLSLERTTLDPLGILAESVDEAGIAAAAKGVTIRRRLPAAPATMQGDANRLRQVFSNILSNAVKFTPSGGAIEVEAVRHADTLAIRISDTGAGMTPEFARNAFGRFTQADYSVRREHGGLGLGLAIAHELVVRHGGSIAASSPGLGRGSTFEVRLPLT
jgi:PAS domain S-box-containing protein